ncbi:hypothetical protein QUA80_17000 [Microcoleus sp. F4-D5]
MFPDAQELYRGSGEARIRGFNPSQGDVLRLAGQLSDYQISPVGADLVISKPEDTIAIIEGGANLNLRQLTFPPASIYSSAKSTFLLGWLIDISQKACQEQALLPVKRELWEMYNRYNSPL